MLLWRGWGIRRVRCREGAVVGVVVVSGRRSEMQWDDHVLVQLVVVVDVLTTEIVGVVWTAKSKYRVSTRVG